MTVPDDVLHDLRSPVPSARLRAVREVGRSGSAELSAELREIRARETNSWVLRAIDSALQRLEGGVVGHALLDIAPSHQQIAEELQSIAIQQVTGVVIHEARPLVQDVLLSARREVADFDESMTRRRVTRLQEFLEVLLILNDAAQAPVLKEHDLLTLVEDARTAVDPTRVLVSTIRTDPVLAHVDATLLRHALVNVLRNALDASTQNQNVVINFGRTDRDAWVAVIDDGEGLPGDLSSVLQAGTSSRSRDTHFGLGLTVVQQAMTSLGGTVHLTRRTSGGTRCELRWPQPN